MSAAMSRRFLALPHAACLLVFLAALALASARGEAPRDGKKPTFERDILPIFSTSCLRCHGAEKRKGGLDLRTFAALARGGDSGNVLVKGASTQSLLYERIALGEMPPDKTKLTSAQARVIRDWIDAGAPADNTSGHAGEDSTRDPDREHWAFQPPRRPTVPAVKHSDRMRTPIDSFLLSRLEARGLTFAPDADRITLARRAYLDLLGLPPTPGEVDAFVADSRADAYERLLDKLLASPHFGERWGRRWLDVAGYADTVGFDIDANLILQSEGKWRYRDYVIDAFNRDKPYNRFVVEQLAGDEMVDWRGADRLTPEMRELLIATGYLRTARDTTHEPESNIPSVYYGVLHDTVAIVGQSLLGLTINCAQCHNHKFDPISQKEYYRLMAQFTPAYNPKHWKPVFPWKKEVQDRGLPGVAPRELAEIRRDNEAVDRKVASLRARQADLRRPHEALLREARLRALPEPIRADAKIALATPVRKRSAIQTYLADKLGASLAVKPEEVTAALTPAERATAHACDEQIAALNRGRRGYDTLQALYDVGPPPPTYLLKRGNYETPGDEVAPGFLRALSDPAHLAAVRSGKAVGPTSGRRAALARWLTEPGSRAGGLLARVWVNRAWDYLFGQGFVATPENFGRSGEPPSHPELLEWLSSELARTGWRLKPLLRLMMTSTAYRQTSHPASAAAGQLDPGNRLLWKMRLRRLEAEVIRDAILAVSGRLDSTMRGPPILTRALPDGMVVVEEKGLPRPSARDRRSVYLLFRRAYNLSLLTVFDQPLVAISCPRRDASAVPLQALSMLNDSFLAEHARHFADRVSRRPAHSPEKIVGTAFRLALARPPSAAEMRLCSQLLERQEAVYRAARLSPADGERKALAQLCLVLFNTSEFLYVE